MKVQSKINKGFCCLPLNLWTQLVDLGCDYYHFQVVIITTFVFNSTFGYTGKRYVNCDASYYLGANFLFVLKRKEKDPEWKEWPVL